MAPTPGIAPLRSARVTPGHIARLLTPGNPELVPAPRVVSAVRCWKN